jgi:hypothetical protein
VSVLARGLARRTGRPRREKSNEKEAAAAMVRPSVAAHCAWTPAIAGVPLRLSGMAVLPVLHSTGSWQPQRSRHWRSGHRDGGTPLAHGRRLMAAVTAPASRHGRIRVSIRVTAASPQQTTERRAITATVICCDHSVHHRSRRPSAVPRRRGARAIAGRTLASVRLILRVGATCWPKPAATHSRAT